MGGATSRKHPFAARGVASVAGALALALVLGPATTGHTAPPRFPRWPTEVDRAASPLYSRATERQASERQRADAVVALDAFATPVIKLPLLFALDDPSLQVRREALRLCYERAVSDCIDGAATLYNDGAEPSLRIAALKVLGLDPRPRSASILIAALRDPSEAIRAQAAELVGGAPLDATMADKARAALLAKLPDVSAVVRRAAVISLGLLGPGDGALALARVLDDPEPTVRAAAAGALGRMRDARVVPALRRAVQSPNEPIVAKALVEALARLETDEREAELLELIDDPPPGLNARQVADAIARRPAVGSALVEGLVQRLREPPLADSCLHALLLLGERARPGIEAALTRGIEAPIAIELRRLLAALDSAPPTTAKAAARRPAWPEAEDTAAWMAALGGPGERERLRAALAIGRRSPAWLGRSAGSRLADAAAPEPQRAWLVALAAAGGAPQLGRATRRAVARLVSWSADASVARADRCLAVLALGSVAAGGDREARAAVVASLQDARAEVRGCATATAHHATVAPAQLEGMLVDPDARVRATAALALATFGADALSRSTTTRLAVMEARDPVGEVRRAAAVARRRAATGAGPSAPGLQLAEPVVDGWAIPSRWETVEGEAPSGSDAAGDLPLWLPTIGLSTVRWVITPGARDADDKSSKYSLATAIDD